MHEDTTKPSEGRLKPILKAPKPATQTQRLNASLQSGLNALRRDLLGGLISSPKESNQTQQNTVNNAHNPFWRVALPSVPLPVVAPSMGHALSVQPLKSVRFTMSSLKVVYPLAEDLPPSEESKTRDTVNTAHRAALASLKGKSWTGTELVKLYEECCRSREEPVLDIVLRALNPTRDSPAPKSLDFTGQQWTLGAAEALSDVLSVDFGLKKLVLEDGGLTDESIKHILHALLVSGSLPTLNLANNRKIKARGWRYIAIFIRKAPALRFIDLSDNAIDKRTADWLTQALSPKRKQHPEAAGDLNAKLPTEVSLPDALASGGLHVDMAPPVPEKDSLLMMTAPLLRDDDLESTDLKPSPVASLRLENCNLRNQALETMAHAIRRSSVKHVSLRRNKISALGSVALAVMMRDYPVPLDSPDASTPSASLLSSPDPDADAWAHPTNSHWTHSNSSHSYPPLLPYKEGLSDSEENLSDVAAFSRARAKLLKEIAVLPRIGNLLTLDVRGNEIKSGALYISQVLKRNRTLKVLNLSDNKIDASGLVAIAEALCAQKYNDSLETLDMSKNPCCGPRTDGVVALRTAFLQNSSLMRVFLASTDLTSEGAIALAEYLPEVKTLIHLDLTENYEIDIAGVMALAVAVRMNKSLRCLDLNIPPNDPDFSRLSQEILQSCIRNTEVAQEAWNAKGIKQPVSAPIHKSTVARNLEASQEQQQARPNRDPDSNIGRVVSAAQHHLDLLSEVLRTDGGEVLPDILDTARAAQFQLSEATLTLEPSELDLNRKLDDLCTQAESKLRAMSSPTLALPPSPMAPHSPSFSITDSDEEEDEPLPEQSTSSDTAPIQIEPTPLSEAESPRSPVELHSRNWVAEESEVFRRKMYLDSLDEDQEDEHLTGEQLKQEILEAAVEPRTAQSPVLTIDQPPLSPTKELLPEAATASPS